MQIVVRYWLAKPPIPYDGHKWDDPAWIDHSTHPATRIGLHNAILAAEDRQAALRQLHPRTAHGSVIFLVQDDESQILSIHEADLLLELFEHGEFSWETMRALLETQRTGKVTIRELDHDPATRGEAHPRNPIAPRLTAYSKESGDEGFHQLDIDI